MNTLRTLAKFVLVLGAVCLLLAFVKKAPERAWLQAAHSIKCGTKVDELCRVFPYEVLKEGKGVDRVVLGPGKLEPNFTGTLYAMIAGEELYRFHCVQIDVRNGKVWRVDFWDED